MTNPRYELRTGKFGTYFHDTHYDGFDMPLDIVLAKLNRLEEYTLRLSALANNHNTAL